MERQEKQVEESPFTKVFPLGSWLGDSLSLVSDYLVSYILAFILAQVWSLLSILVVLLMEESYLKDG